jgi:macrocin-O-methyltransferase TylF-like protien
MSEESLKTRPTGKQIMKGLRQIHVDQLFDPARRFYSYKLISLYAVLPEITLPGDYAEFGVYKGQCARFFSSFVVGARLFHLFDSFEGLPEDWTGQWKKGHFDLKGQLPDVDPKVTRVYKGWFKDTVPPFAAKLKEPLSFLHMDCDLYSSTVDVLFPLNGCITPGTILLFDEYIFEEREDEHRALYDWAESCHREFEYLWRTQWLQVAVRITR